MIPTPRLWGALCLLALPAVAAGFLPGVWISYAVDGGLTGIWSGLVAFIVIRLIAVVLRFRSMRWAVVHNVESSSRKGGSL